MKLSIILPTYNNEKTIGECLSSIFSQNFPKKEFEVLFIDGGSSDKTIEIAKKYPVKIIKNPYRVEEKARMMGIKKSGGEIVAFIDADNVLVGNDWMKKMVKPFKDKEVIFVDTLYYSFRKTDKIIVKYQALIGGDDPIVMYLGFYSRWCYLTDNWTGYPYASEDSADYLKIKLKDKNKVPAMGSNGFLVRTKIAKKFVKNSFIHSDFVYDLISSDYNCFAKVKTGIIHNQPKFFPNKIRRIIRRLKNEVRIKYDYGVTRKEMAKTIICIVLVFPVLFDTIKGFIKKPDLAWFFHPIACFGELFLHGLYTFKYKILGKIWKN